MDIDSSSSSSDSTTTNHPQIADISNTKATPTIIKNRRRIYNQNLTLQQRRQLAITLLQVQQCTYEQYAVNHRIKCLNREMQNVQKLLNMLQARNSNTNMKN